MPFPLFSMLAVPGLLVMNAVETPPPAPPGMTYLIDNIMSPGEVRDTAGRLRNLGLTAVQTYVTWESCEGRGKGAWNWSLWDETLEVLAAHDLEWVPFLIAGPAYATPQWFREGPFHVPSTCLEHNKDSKIQSLWNPHFPYWVHRFLSAFAERYGGHERINSLNLGIQGDYGEAIYSVTGDWTQTIPGPYHNHAGFWCGDAYGLRDFQNWTRQRYGNLPFLNATWGTKYPDFDSVDFPARGDALETFRAALQEEDAGAARRYWLDFVAWYRGAMTSYACKWMDAARSLFPDTPVYLCTGGHAPPEHGAHFAEQARIATAHGGGIRITNEGSDFAGNFVMTRMVATACRYYGAPFGFEPAQFEDEAGILARVFNATTSGASQMTDKNYNVLDGHLESMPPSRIPELPTRAEAINRAYPFLFHVPEPVIHVAVWYPETTLMLEGKGFPEIAAAREFRFYMDHDYVDETLLRAGALKKYRALVILYGTVMEPTDALIIRRWVEQGGLLLIAGVSRLTGVCGEPLPEEQLFGGAAKDGAVGQGHVLRLKNLETAAERLNVFLESQGKPVARIKSGHAFSAQVAKNRWLVLNTTEAEAVVAFSHGEQHEMCFVPPYSIRDFSF